MKKILSLSLAMAVLFTCTAFASATGVSADSATETVKSATGVPTDSATETVKSATVTPGDSVTAPMESNTYAPDQEIDGTLNFDSPRISRLVIDQIATSNGKSAWYDYFDTTDENPTYRVWIDNTGDYSIQLVIKRGDFDSNDNMLDPVTIAPGKQYSISMTTDNEGNSPGRRWVVINPISGNAFEANVQVRIAPSFSELG